MIPKYLKLNTSGTNTGSLQMGKDTGLLIGSGGAFTVNKFYSGLFPIGNSSSSNQFSCSHSAGSQTLSFTATNPNSNTDMWIALVEGNPSSIVIRNALSAHGTQVVALGDNPALFIAVNCSSSNINYVEMSTFTPGTLHRFYRYNGTIYPFFTYAWSNNNKNVTITEAYNQSWDIFVVQ